MIVVFEGADGVGKTSLATMLAIQLRLEGKKVKYFAFPSSSPVGNLARDVLNRKIHMSPEGLQVLFSVDRWNHKSLIETHVAEGYTVILDRWIYSGYAYGNTTRSDEGLPRGDIVFYITRDILKDSGDLFENAEKQKLVLQRYEEILPTAIRVSSGGKAFDEICAHM